MVITYDRFNGEYEWSIGCNICFNEMISYSGDSIHDPDFKTITFTNGCGIIGCKENFHICTRCWKKQKYSNTFDYAHPEIAKLLKYFKCKIVPTQNMKTFISSIFTPSISSTPSTSSTANVGLCDDIILNIAKYGVIGDSYKSIKCKKLLQKNPLFIVRNVEGNDEKMLFIPCILSRYKKSYILLRNIDNTDYTFESEMCPHLLLKILQSCTTDS